MYVDTPAVSARLSRTRDPIVFEIRKRQYVNWIDLRFESWTSAAVGLRLAELAKMTGGALRTRRRSRSQSNAARAAGPVADEPVSGSASRTPVRSDRAALRASSRTIAEPTLIVDPLPNRGDYTSVQDAITHAPPGARVVVHPGVYQGGLVLDKPLEIIGEGARTTSSLKLWVQMCEAIPLTRDIPSDVDGSSSRS